jgi:hypothetical protein
MSAKRIIAVAEAMMRQSRRAAEPWRVGLIGAIVFLGAWG